MQRRNRFDVRYFQIMEFNFIISLDGAPMKLACLPAFGGKFSGGATSKFA